MSSVTDRICPPACLHPSPHAVTTHALKYQATYVAFHTSATNTHLCRSDMATLDFLKRTLGQKAKGLTSLMQPLSDSQYDAGFNILMQGPGRKSYQDFIIPQLTLLLAPLADSHVGLSVLEIGPGPESVLGCLPGCLRSKIKRYAAFEPNDLFATRLGEWLRFASKIGLPLPSLESPPGIYRVSFNLDSNTGIGAEEFDVILFCHSMYGMKPKTKFIERALHMLRPGGGMVVIFHRNGTLRFDGLTCHRTASFPNGVICVADDDESLNCFASFIAGFVVQHADANDAIHVEWRKVCCTLGRREEAHPHRLFFSSPETMMAFTKYATNLLELTAHVPVVSGDDRVKNRVARLHCPASFVRPEGIRDVQQCVRWALSHNVSLTIVGGGHSGHCQWNNVVAVDMGSFSLVQIVMPGDEGISASDSSALIVVEAGCKTGDIVRKTLAAGLTVPLGSRPGVGAGLWLQGGIGHLARLHGLACDSIIGAVVVSVATGQILYVGHVPSQHRPAGAVQPENDTDLLWAMKGAGNNFGIVISVTFKAYTAHTYSIRNWIVPLSDNLEARRRLSDLNEHVARKLPRHCSIDAYLYWDTKKLHLGLTMFESFATGETPTPTPVGIILGPEDNSKIVDGVGLFDTEMYMSGMHGGHSGGKTSAFKRCVFLKDIGAVGVVDSLVAAIETRPSPHCYLHLLHGGGAVGDMAEDATAFGCRDWDFACVITGVWPRDQDGAELTQTTMEWVYNIARRLLPFSSGAYGADLGPDPRDAVLAVKAFGPNLSRLVRLKKSCDPGRLLAYACPLLKAPKFIVLVTGESCVGKDYCAEIWASAFNICCQKLLKARAVSISDAIKREYAAATDANVNRLLQDRAYKEQHRPALSTYFKDQVRQQPWLPEEHFLTVVFDAVDVDVLMITGMRDEAPVAALSHLVPDSRLLEVRVTASREMRAARRGCQGDDDNAKDGRNTKDRPDFIFINNKSGNEAAKAFFERHLLPFSDDDLQRLANMVRRVLNFPRPGIEFRDVLGISQQPGGLALCTSLLQTHFIGAWPDISVIACCETGGFVFASTLAAQVDKPLALIREEGKLPPPTISAIKCPSYISSSAPNGSGEKRIEISQNVITKGASVVVVDDVLATGKTLCAVLQLLDEAGIGAEDVNVMVVAEFPIHRGRELVRHRGFGGAKIQSLLVFGGT